MTTNIHFESGEVVELPYLKPTDTLKVLLSDYPWLLLGGCKPDESQQLLLSFWDAYRLEHGGHAVFNYDRERLAKTVPMTFHGDGGRTQKKEPLEIFSMQPVLGLDCRASASKQCSCSTSEEYSGDLGSLWSQRVNSKHSSYLHHFLCFAYPSKEYKSVAGLLDSMIAAVTTDFASACEKGITTESGDLYFVACLGIKADMEWQKKIGSLSRSYMNVGTANELATCHECDAGLPQVPFEDVNTTATWLQTRYRSLPWNSRPPWHKVPFDDSKPALFLRRDSFHVFRLGVGRNFAAGCILLMCYMGCFDDAESPGESLSVTSRLERAYGFLKLYCHFNKLQIRIRGFTLQNMHYGGQKTYPWLGCKGSDSIVVLKWIMFFAALQCQVNVLSREDQQVFTWMVDGAKAGIFWGQGLHSHGLWLKKNCNRDLARAVQRFASCYCRLADVCFKKGYNLFGMVPKLHAMVHFRADLDDCMERAQEATLSPACFDNSMSEDFIGRIAKQSRRISFKKIERELLFFYRTKTKLQIDKFKKQNRL